MGGVYSSEEEHCLEVHVPTWKCRSCHCHNWCMQVAHGKKLVSFSGAQMKLSALPYLTATTPEQYTETDHNHLFLVPPTTVLHT